MTVERREQSESDLPMTRVGETDLKKLHGVGPKALGQLRHALSRKGWAFADKNGG